MANKDTSLHCSLGKDNGSRLRTAPGSEGVGGAPGPPGREKPGAKLTRADLSNLTPKPGGAASHWQNTAEALRCLFHLRQLL